eukprot:720401-Pleurochrysis_carterae.AAC.2
MAKLVTKKQHIASNPAAKRVEMHLKRSCPTDPSKNWSKPCVLRRWHQRVFWTEAAYLPVLPARGTSPERLAARSQGPANIDRSARSQSLPPKPWSSVPAACRSPRCQNTSGTQRRQAD